MGGGGVQRRWETEIRRQTYTEQNVNLKKKKKETETCFSHRRNLEKLSLHSYHTADANHIYRMDYCRRPLCVQIILQILGNHLEAETPCKE